MASTGTTDNLDMKKSMKDLRQPPRLALRFSAASTTDRPSALEFPKYLQNFCDFSEKIDKLLFFCDIARECSRIQERIKYEKNTDAATHTFGAPNGDPTLQTLRSRTGLAPGVKRELSSSYENFPRIKNGPDRCQPREPFKKCFKN
jgi:hypothetical protein